MAIDQTGVPIEDLKIGDWIIVIRDEERERLWPDQVIEYAGFPTKILAKSLPFLAVLYGCEVRTIDVRNKVIRRSNPHYARLMNAVLSEAEAAKPTPRRPRKKKKKPPTDPRDCPNCGERRVIRTGIVNGEREMYLTCLRCGSSTPHEAR